MLDAFSILSDLIEQNKNMKTIEIQIPEGHEVDEEKSTFTKIVFREKKYKYAETLYDIDRRFYTDAHGNVCKVDAYESQSPNHFSTEERGEEVLALIQLLEFRDNVNKVDGFVPNWQDVEQNKYCISLHSTRFPIEVESFSPRLLSFGSTETAEQFLETHKELIEKCKNLI